MKNSQYWADRFTALDDTEYKKSKKYLDNVDKQFERAKKQISKDIAYWYGRLAENNDLSYSGARKLLDADELEDFHLTVEEYIKHGEEDGLDPEWMKKLENASGKKHISRLEQIQTEMQQAVERLYKEYEVGVAEHLSGVTQDMYYHTAYEVAKGTGIGVSLHRLDTDTVEGFLSRPWCQDGKVFSDRIWSRKDDLIASLNNELAQNLITGRDPQKAIDAIAKEFNVEKSAAGRLVMTETAAIQNEARQKCMKDLDVEEFEFVATLDSHTSEICQAMDGQHFPMSQFKIGLNAPPLHCNCRSCTVPYFNDEFTEDETRAARDGKDEGYERVPSSMTYEEWKKKYTVEKNANDDKINIEVDEFTPCLRRVSDNSLVDTSFEEVHPQKGDYKGWEFDWTKPEKNGYTVYALHAEGDSRTQGLLSIMDDKANSAMHIGIVESAPFNNSHNKKIPGKEYAGVGAHLFAEAVRQSYEKGYDGFVIFEAKTNLIDYYQKLLGAKQIGASQSMYIDERAAAILFEKYYGGKK